jgi:uncharacterized coiled-coil protein SlyX
MAEALEAQGVSRTRVRRDWRILVGRNHETEERAMESTTAERPHGPARTEEQRPPGLMDVERLQAENTALRERLGKLEARVAMQERAIQAVEAQGQALALKVSSHEIIVMTIQELLDLCSKNDDCWQSVESMLYTSSTATRGALHQFVAEKVGRPRPLKYIRQ